MDGTSPSFGILRFFHSKQAENLPLLSGPSKKEGFSKPRHVYSRQSTTFPSFLKHSGCFGTLSSPLCPTAHSSKALDAQKFQEPHGRWLQSGFSPSLPVWGQSNTSSSLKHHPRDEPLLSHPSAVPDMQTTPITRANSP